MNASLVIKKGVRAMNKYRVEGTMKAKGKVEFLILARSLEDAMDLCDEDPRDFVALSMLDSKDCEMEFEADEVVEVGLRAVGNKQ
jgi:inactivated superfamily I helicase